MTTSPSGFPTFASRHAKVTRPFQPLFWLLANLGSRIRYTPRVAECLTKVDLPETFDIVIPTRYGPVRSVVQKPPPTHSLDRDPPPLIIHLHGGGFLQRHPEQDRHVARYFATEVGAVVVLPDYSTAPEVCYPVAEEQMVDLAGWLVKNSTTHGWDGSRMLLSGSSAGGKLAINICQQIHRDGGQRPLAVSLLVPMTDATRTDRTSSIPRPAISPFVQRLVGWAYFPDVARRREALASPRFDHDLAAAMPATLIQVAANDTLAPEGEELARVLTAGGVDITLRSYPDADHGMGMEEPVERVEAILGEIVKLFQRQLGMTPSDRMT